MAALAGKKVDKRGLEIVKPTLYNPFPSSGISVFNSGYSGLKSGLVAGSTFDSTVSPAISFDSAGHLFNSGLFGSGVNEGFVTGAPVVGGISAVTGLPAFSEGSVVTAAPSVVTAAPSIVTAAPSVVTAAPPVVTPGPIVGEGFHFGSGVVNGGLWHGGALEPAVVGSGEFLFNFTS